MAKKLLILLMIVALFLFIMQLTQKKDELRETIYLGVGVDSSDTLFGVGGNDSGQRLVRTFFEDYFFKTLADPRFTVINDVHMLYFSPYTYLWGYDHLTPSVDSKKGGDEVRESELKPDLQYIGTSFFKKFREPMLADILMAYADGRVESKYLLLLDSGVNLFGFLPLGSVREKGRINTDDSIYFTLHTQKLLFKGKEIARITDTTTDLWNLGVPDESKILVGDLSSTGKKAVFLVTDGLTETPIGTIDMPKTIISRLLELKLFVYQLFIDSTDNLKYKNVKTAPDPVAAEMFNSNLDYKLLLLLGIEINNYENRRTVRDLQLGSAKFEKGSNGNLYYDPAYRSLVVTGPMKLDQVTTLEGKAYDGFVERYVNVFGWLDFFGVQYWKTLEKGKIERLYWETNNPYNFNTSPSALGILKDNIGGSWKKSVMALFADTGQNSFYSRNKETTFDPASPSPDVKKWRAMRDSFIASSNSLYLSKPFYSETARRFAKTSGQTVVFGFTHADLVSAAGFNGKADIVLPVATLSLENGEELRGHSEIDFGAFEKSLVRSCLVGIALFALVLFIAGLLFRRMKVGPLALFILYILIALLANRFFLSDAVYSLLDYISLSDYRLELASAADDLAGQGDPLPYASNTIVREIMHISSSKILQTADFWKITSWALMFIFLFFLRTNVQFGKGEASDAPFMRFSELVKLFLSAVVAGISLSILFSPSFFSGLVRGRLDIPVILLVVLPPVAIFLFFFYRSLVFKKLVDERLKSFGYAFHGSSGRFLYHAITDGLFGYSLFLSMLVTAAGSLGSSSASGGIVAFIINWKWVYFAALLFVCAVFWAYEDSKRRERGKKFIAL